MATNREKNIDNLSNGELVNLLANKCNIHKNKINTYSDETNEAVNIENWLSQEVEEERTCGSCKFHKKVKPCIGAIDKKCVNSKSKSYGTYIMNDCSCDVWESKNSCGIDENHTQVANITNETKKVELIEEGNNKTIFIQLPKDETTSKAIETLLLELHIMSARLDKLEKCNRIAEVKEHIEERLKEKTKYSTKDMRPMTKEDAEELVNKIGRCAEEVSQMNKTADEMFEELEYKRCSTINWKWVKLSDTDCNYLTYILIYNNKFAKWDEKGNGTQYRRLITEAEDKAIHKKIEELKQYES